MQFSGWYYYINLGYVNNIYVVDIGCYLFLYQNKFIHALFGSPSTPKDTMEMMSMDHILGLFGSSLLCVMVDHLSKWVEVKIVLFVGAIEVL